MPNTTALPLEQTGPDGVHYSFSSIVVPTDAKAGDTLATVTITYPDGWYEDDGEFSFSLYADNVVLFDGTVLNTTDLLNFVRTGVFDPATNTTVYDIKLGADIEGSVITQDFRLGIGFIGYSEDGNTPYVDKVTFVMDLGGDGVPIENSAPEDIALSNMTISEGARAGAVLGILSATDPDGDVITWSLVDGQGDNDNYFDLKTNQDGTVSVVLHAPLDFEGLNAVNGVYDLVVKATDTSGNETTKMISIQSTDELMLMAASPTGKNYVGVVESAPEGTEIGFFVDFDDRSTPLQMTLVDDDGGLFAINTRTVDGVTRYYLATNGSLDYETDNLHSVTVRATDADGNTQDKVYDVHVLDAPESGDTARGTITIDANTALATENGGVDWDSYIQDAFEKAIVALPNGVTFAPATSSEYLYNYDGDKGLISLKGSDLAYWWTDPATGEDVHVVGGTVNSLSFGNNDDGVMTKTELSITGLDLTNGSALLDRIYGEANAIASVWMHGADGSAPAEIEFVKALLASYAQNFVGSAGGDAFTGTYFDDTVAGNGGNDRLAGGGGNDAINGGAGIDTAIFTGAEADYTYLSTGTGSWTVTDNRVGAVNDGADTLTGIERLQFSDSIVGNNTAPTGIAISKKTIAENVAAGTVVGVLSATDVEGDALTWSLSGGGGKFELATKNGVTRLVVDGALDYETKSSYSLTLTASDGDLETSKTVTITVSDLVDHVNGTSGPDTLKGGSGVDLIKGLGGNDKLYGLAGDDVFYGGAGADLLSGGAGVDTASYSDAAKGVTASLSKFSLNTNDAKGDSYSSIENLTGTAHADKLQGDGKANTLRGGDGADILDGGKGIDNLYGGTGGDTFVFHTGDSGKTKALADTIYDFTKGHSIDLTGWDANSKKGGVQDFDFIGADAFSKTAGELHFVKSKSNTWIEGDTNGDGKADFFIHLDDAVTLKAAHFDL